MTNDKNFTTTITVAQSPEAVFAAINDPRAWCLREVHNKAKNVVWLNPESPSAWGFGDSVMDKYLPAVDIAEECRNLRQLSRIVDKLPIQWTKDSITVAGQTYSAADHVPVMIYPNPLNPEHYVVLNIGQSGELRGRGGSPYGDVAVLKVNRGDDGEVTHDVEWAGVFNEQWQLP